MIKYNLNLTVATTSTHDALIPVIWIGVAILLGVFGRQRPTAGTPHVAVPLLLELSSVGSSAHFCLAAH